MTEIFLIAVAVAVLLAAGAVMARGIGKRGSRKPEAEKEDLVFESKYDQIVHLYKKGEINEEEYKSQMRNIIN